MRYAGTSADDNNYHGSNWRGKAAERSAASAAANMLPLQTDVSQLMPPEISEFADSAPPDGGGLEEDPDDTFDVREGSCGDSGRFWQGEDTAFRRESRGPSAGAGESTELSITEKGGNRTQYVGGLLPGLGESDVTLVLDDGSRLPAHSCLLAAFSGAFRDLFLRRDGLNCQGLCCTSCDHGNHCSSGKSVGPSTGTSGASCARANGDAGADDQHKRSRDVQLLLAGCRLGSEEAADKRPPQTCVATSEAAAAAAAFAVTSIAENTAWQSPAVVEWGPARGDVLVRFWGAGTMAAVVRHMYTGQTPAHVHIDGLGRLLTASVALRMPRLMRQVEHLLSASLSSQKGSDRSAQLKEVARLLRAARALRATDLEHRCTLYLQANGGFPAVMKVRCRCDCFSETVVLPRSRDLPHGWECASFAAALNCVAGVEVSVQYFQFWFGLKLLSSAAPNSKRNTCPVACLFVANEHCSYAGSCAFLLSTHQTSHGVWPV